jgi:hypothetical protein
MLSIQLSEKTGEVTHNFLFDEKGNKRTFASEDVYKRWLASQRSKMFKHYR